MAVLIDRRTLLRALGALPAALPLRAGSAAQTGPRGGVLRFTRVPFSRGIIPHAGATSMELYHKHPHDPREEVVQPDDIRLQTRLTLRNHKEILDWLGLGWTNVVKLTRYQTRMEESPAIDAVLRSYFGDWRPAQTIYQVNGLSSPQARLEIEMWVDPRGTRQAKGLRPVVPRPEVTGPQAFSLAIEIGPDMDLIFCSGLTAYPPDLDPWNPGSFTMPADAAERGRLATDHLDRLLTAAGTTWQQIVFNVNWNAPGGGAINMNAQYGESWRPCSTTLRVNDTGVPGIGVLYQITAVAPHRPITTKGAVAGIEPILLRPGVALKELPQAPAIRVTRDVDLVYFPGVTAYPPDIDPWNRGSYTLPDDLATQEKMVADNIDRLLKGASLTWRHIVVMNRVGEVRGVRWMEDRFGDWRPCRTTRAVPTGIPGARLLVELAAAAPPA
ncbi:MAG: RidA family protein [Acidobacteria bacterium]|nr:RidA family protein [Acidobacteriota bacterium]